MSELAKLELCELEVEDGELRNLRQRISAEKQALQGQAAELNSKCSVRLPTQLYQKIQKQRSEIVKLIAQKESELGDINAKRAELQTVIQVRKIQMRKIVPSDMKKLVEMRDRWHAFSMDSEQHQKAREVAFAVSQELKALLKSHFEPEPCAA